MKKLTTIITSGLLTTGASAATISVNMDSSGGVGDMAAGTSAGVENVANWNNITSGSQSGTSTGSALKDDSGTATSASLTVFNGFWSTNNSTTTGNHQMFSDYTNTSASANGIITVSGLGTDFTTNGYSVILYLGGTDSMGLNTPAEFGGNIDGADEKWIRSYRRDPSFNGAWNSDTFTTEALAQASSTESNYIQFDGLSAASFTLNVLKDASSTANWTRAGVRGVQIVANPVPVPEPSSTALLGLGGLALIIRRRK